MSFSFVDFIIGLTLVNSLPHFVLGIWGGRIMSGLGFGNRANIAYGLLNFVISISLFLYKYGVGGLLENGIYLGGLFILLSYFTLAKFLHQLFSRNQ